MAAGVYLPIEPHSPGIYGLGTVTALEKASQTYKKGAPLVLNGGYVEEAGTAPATIKYIASENGQNGATDGAKSTQVWPVEDVNLWKVCAEDALAQTDIGSVYGLVKDATTGFWYLDSADAGDQMVVEGFVQTPSLGAIGDTKAQVLARFQAANIAGF